MIFQASQLKSNAEDSVITQAQPIYLRQPALSATTWGSCSVGNQAIATLAQKLDLLAVMAIVPGVAIPEKSQSSQIDLLYSRSSFNSLAGKQQVLRLNLPKMIAAAAEKTVENDVPLLSPFKVVDCDDLDCRHKRLKCYVVSDCGILSDGVTSDIDDAVAAYSGKPFSLVLWSHQALSTSQKYCIEQQVRLVRLAEHLQQERLYSTQKISLLEQAVQQIEHQLRTPLSLVELYTDLLSGYASADALTKPVQAIRQIVSDMGVSLKRLANCGLMSHKQAIACDLGAIIQESARAIRPQSDSKEVSVLCDRHPLPAMVDVWQMQQVFHNLLHNAIAFSPPKSVVDCRWQVFQQEVVIEIRDQGSGFSSQDLKSLFNPYYSRREGGTGLGLAIAQKIILDHQGTITAANLPEGGAQISIMLPRTH